MKNTLELSTYPKIILEGGAEIFDAVCVRTPAEPFLSFLWRLISFCVFFIMMALANWLFPVSTFKMVVTFGVASIFYGFNQLVLAPVIFSQHQGNKRETISFRMKSFVISYIVMSVVFAIVLPFVTKEELAFLCVLLVAVFAFPSGIINSLSV